MAGLMVVAVSVAGCIAPDVVVIGALGVTVDEEQRPILVVQSCEGAVAGVDLTFDREGLADDQENEQVAAWIPQAPVRGVSELVLHAPTDAWQGEAVDVVADRGYIASAVGEGDSEVLTQVAFRGMDLLEMRPGAVYRNAADPDEKELVGGSAEDFTAYVCSRR